MLEKTGARRLNEGVARKDGLIAEEGGIFVCFLTEETGKNGNRRGEAGR